MQIFTDIHLQRYNIFGDIYLIFIEIFNVYRDKYRDIWRDIFRDIFIEMRLHLLSELRII